MQRPKFVILLLITLVCMVSVHASEDFLVRSADTYADIFPDEEAIFTIQVSNNLETDVRFQVKFGSEVDWIIDTIPADAYYPLIGRKTSRNIDISIRPKDYVPIGRHRIRINVQNTNTREIKFVDFDILLKPIEWKKFLPNIQLRVDMDNDIDPRKATVITVDLKNLNRFNITNLKIELDSKLIHEERTIDLPQISKTTEAFLVTFNKLQGPMDDVLTVTVSVTHENKTYKWEATEKFEILMYSDLIENSTYEKSFLRKTEEISLENNGNVAKDFEITREAPFLKRLFTRTEPKSGLLKTSEGTFLYWKITLEPQGQAEIKVTQGYRTIFTLIIIIIVLILLYYIYRPPVTIKKEVTQIGTSEGGISEIKVILHLRSRTRKVIELINVIDKIPHIAEIGEEFQVGTLKPTKITRTTKKGTLVRWEIPTLDAYEERIITYKLKSRLSILGGIVLPPALVRFQKKSGKEIRTRSNRVTLEI